MADIVDRFPGNPLIRPQDVPPSGPGMLPVGALNPAAFRFEGRTWLLVRIAEAAEAAPGCVAVPVLDAGRARVLQISKDDPALDLSDPRLVVHSGRTLLSTLSHLRLFVDDGTGRFRPAEDRPPLAGDGAREAYGIEDPRVTETGDEFLVTCTAVSGDGFGVGLRRTRDWRTFHNEGMILPPPNKDCVIFPAKVSGAWWCLHRPSARQPGGNDIWVAHSPDILHWGGHGCVARTRPGLWDEARIGAGGPPIRTDEGWLVIYHGADRAHRYCLGALLLDIDNPARLLARSAEPFMEPTADYERHGFFNDVVFSNGHVVDGSDLILYYGGADAVVCGARVPLQRLLTGLKGC